VSADAFAPVACGDDHCITCGDDGVAMTVLALEGEPGLALCVDGEGQRHTVETELVAPIQLGDEVLVHAGTALTALSRAGTAVTRAHAKAQA
jgi:hydrogenase maturation factor